MFLICSKGFKIDFQNRKWNYPNRKWNYFSHLIKKTFFMKCFSFVPRGSKSTIMQQKLWSHCWVTMRLRIKYLFTKCLPLMDLNSQSQHQTMFSENVKIDYTLKSGHKNGFVVYLYISLRNCYFYPFLSNNINK